MTHGNSSLLQHILKFLHRILKNLLQSKLESNGVEK